MRRGSSIDALPGESHCPRVAFPQQKARRSHPAPGRETALSGAVLRFAMPQPNGPRRWNPLRDPTSTRPRRLCARLSTEGGWRRAAGCHRSANYEDDQKPYEYDAVSTAVTTPGPKGRWPTGLPKPGPKCPWPCRPTITSARTGLATCFTHGEPKPATHAARRNSDRHASNLMSLSRNASISVPADEDPARDVAGVDCRGTVAARRSRRRAQGMTPCWECTRSRWATAESHTDTAASHQLLALCTLIPRSVRA